MSHAEGAGELFFAALAEPEISVEHFLRDLLPDLLGYFLNRLDDHEDAADAVADTLLVLWRKEKSIPTHREGARRYSFGVARKVLQSTRRGRQRRSSLAHQLRAAVVEHTVASPLIDLELKVALESLSEKDRELVLLVAWEGFSVADAGRVLGLSQVAARARYSRARSRLRAEL